MKLPIVCLFLAVFAVSSSAQVTARRALQPLTKQGVIPPTPGQREAAAAAAARANAAQTPAPAAAKPGAQAAATIEADLQPSKVTLFGKIEGLSGTLFVTNVGVKAVAPFVQLAVIDKDGRTVGYVTNGAPEIQPKTSEKIQVLATNLNAVDLKIVRLVSHK